MKTQIYYNMDMEKKSSNIMALLFVLLVAVLLAAFCTLIFVVGKTLYKGISKHKSSAPVVAQASQPAPVVPFVAVEDTKVPPLPPEVEEEPTSTEVEQSASAVPEICPATAVPVKIQKSRRKKKITQFEKGLKQCMAGGIFPCAWEDNSRGLPRQYWLMSAAGPVQRGIYDRAGNLIHETIAEVSGTVTSYTERDTTYYFEGGVLVKIRTNPYDNCNLYDWFFIDASGKQDVCQCAYNQADCCARSPYKEGGPRTYCGLNPLDRDFCK